MKRCPECTSGFPDTFEFCERDGTTLVADFWDGHPESSKPPAVTRESQEPTDAPPPHALPPPPFDPPGVMVRREYSVSGDSRLRQNWIALALMAVGGIAIGLVFFVVYQTNEDSNQNANELIANGALTQQPVPVLPLRSSSPDSASPSPEPSPSPSESPSPSPQVESAPLTVSSGMVSTGGDEKAGRGPFVIRLTNGTNVEADEVWQTEDGIWYRRRGVATLVDRKDVKAIERVEDKNSSAPASPAPTPASSRVSSP
ncbi:MAG: hypothetical protein ACRD9S_11760 [Pyrinomonadaceae bacterium]